MISGGEINKLKQFHAKYFVITSFFLKKKSQEKMQFNFYHYKTSNMPNIYFNTVIPKCSCHNISNMLDRVTMARE